MRVFDRGRGEEAAVSNKSPPRSSWTVAKRLGIYMTAAALSCSAVEAAAPHILPPAFRGLWALEPKDCYSGSPFALLVTATMVRDAPVQHVRRLGPGAIDVELRTPSGEVRRQLILASRGSLLRVAEELGILNYTRCAVSEVQTRARLKERAKARR